MALNTGWAHGLGGYLCVLGVALSGCRANTVCSSEGCRDGTPQTGGSTSGGTAARGGRPGFGGESEGGSAAGGAGDDFPASGGAESGAAAGGEAYGGAPLESNCQGLLVECDGSSLTVCETDLAQNVRHCGACAQECDGICGGGICEPATVVAPLYARSMVASGTTGFALVHDGRGEFSVLKVDMVTAEGEAYLDNVAEDTRLVVSGDRVYLASPDSSGERVELRSAALDGSGLALEPGIEPFDIGATPDGVYYVSRVTDEETNEDTFGLHFRPTGSGVWQPLDCGTRCRILASSEFGMIVSKGDDEDGELFLINGAHQTSLGPAPADLMEVAVAREAVVMLTHDWELGVSKLWWKQPDVAPSVYEVEAPSNDAPELTVLKDDVVLYFQDHGTAAIQFFNRAGPFTERLGVAPFSHVLLADPNFAWYTVADTWLTSRFVRSQWFQLP